MSALLALVLAVPAAPQAADGAPRSPLTAPLYLGEAPPDCRSLRVLRLDHVADDAPDRGGRTRAQALELARNVVRLARAGADLGELVRQHGSGRAALDGGVLGTFPPGVLLPAFDAFLFAAELGEVSAPIEAEGAVHVLQRVERWAACRQIFLRGREPEVRERAEALARRARAGEDFAALAREHSEDPTSAARGGAWRVFERGPDDALLKAAAFDAAVGEVFGPLESPLGWHVGRRVPPAELDALDPDLRESSWVRARAVVVAHETSRPVRAARDLEAAKGLAREIHALAVERGEGLAELARRHTDEPGGRERAGDLGWLHRRNPNRLRPLDRLFLAEPGRILEPLPSEAGWLVLERTW